MFPVPEKSIPRQFRDHFYTFFLYLMNQPIFVSLGTSTFPFSEIAFTPTILYTFLIFRCLQLFRLWFVSSLMPIILGHCTRNPPPPPPPPSPGDSRGNLENAKKWHRSIFRLILFPLIFYYTRHFVSSLLHFNPQSNGSSFRPHDDHENWISNAMNVILL